MTCDNYCPVLPTKCLYASSSRRLAKATVLANRQLNASERSQSPTVTATCEFLSESETSSRTAESATTSHSSNSGKQSKTFHSSWRHGRPWLKYVADVQGMFCSLCQKYNKLPYNRDYWNKSPCRRIRLSSITKHEESAAHVECVKREASSTLNPRTNIAAAMNPSRYAASIHLPLFFGEAKNCTNDKLRASSEPSGFVRSEYQRKNQSCKECCLYF